MSPTRYLSRYLCIQNCEGVMKLVEADMRREKTTHSRLLRISVLLPSIPDPTFRHVSSRHLNRTTIQMPQPRPLAPTNHPCANPASPGPASWYVCYFYRPSHRCGGCGLQTIDLFCAGGCSRCHLRATLCGASETSDCLHALRSAWL